MSIVFFVFLKFVKPGDFIEDAIIHQRDKLQGGNMNRKKLTYILETFGPECLLILDGLDECAFGQNSDVLKVIIGSKFTNCNILLTSRPHSTREFERYFDTIISVEGFTRSEARKFALKIVPDENKVQAILDFNPAGERSDGSVHNVPILLSFLCLLVREDNIDLSDKSVSMGEIYFRMVQCLYKKFTLRKKIRFETSSVVNVLKSLGKLALETLLSGNPLLERSDITEQVGEDVFDYGLLIGEDSFTLTRDMTVGILVTFPHRSLQEFLAAFYFVLSLGKKQAINHVDKAVQEYLRNPLFSEFCIWLSDESNTFFLFLERPIAYETLIIYVAEHMDAAEVDFQKLERNYPALNLALGDNRNEMALKLLEGAVVKCTSIKHMVIEPHHSIDRILRSISPFIFQRLNSIKISNCQEEKDDKSPLRLICVWHDRSFNFAIKCDLCEQQSVDALNTVLKISEGWSRSVYLFVGKSTSGISLQDFSSVHTFNNGSSHKTLPMYTSYPQLVNLFLTDCGLDSRDMSHLAEASKQGRLPRLSTLDLSDNPRLCGNLSVLLSHCFPSLHTLILSSCKLQISDIHNLAQARTEARLPQLRHLDVSFNYSVKFGWKSHSDKSLLPLLFQQGIPTLKTLVVRNCRVMADDLCALHPQAVGNKFLSELTTLDMSLNPAIGGSLSALMCHYFLHLQILVLRRCEINSADMMSLSQASSYGRLPELRHLDISQNIIGGKKRGLLRLLGGLKSFPSLINLIFRDCDLELQDLCCLAQAKLDGKLPRIRHLDISLNGLSDHVGILSRDPITQREINWGNVICCEKYR